MEQINAWLIRLDGWMGGSAWFPALLLMTGLFFTVYLGFPQLRFFRRGLQVLSGKHANKDAAGETTHFQALSTALSGTIGTGNIGGVAFALFLGGPAALFWMWMTAFLGMATKMVEVTLSHKYREQMPDGSVSGGPMYYMEKRLNLRWLAIVFAVAAIICSFGIGNFPQINSIAAGLQASFSIPVWVSGALLALMLGLVILGGIQRIAAVTSRLVPAMALLYLLGAAAVILPNLSNVPASFLAIFHDAFTGTAAAGGFLGASIAYAFNRGVNRGLFSNEAGLGSAAIAHASARTREPLDEGVVSLMEPFIDTIVICTITGLVILSSGVWLEKHEQTFARADLEIVAGNYTDANEQDRQVLFRYLNGDESSVEAFDGELTIRDGVLAEPADITILHARSVAEGVRFLRQGQSYNGVLAVSGGQLVDTDVELVGRSLLHSVPLTSMAFTRGWLGDSGAYLVALGLLLFAFSTALAWSYYGDRAIVYLFGQWAVMPYRIVYTAGFFMAASIDTTIIWNVAAVAMIVMAVPNLIGILLLRKEISADTHAYSKRV